jgi:hypothetical protein
MFIFHLLYWTTDGSANSPVHVLGPGFLPSRTSIPGGVRGSPQKLSDSSHPSHRLFSLLSHSKRYRSVRLLNSFYPQAIRLLNTWSIGYPNCLHCPSPLHRCYSLFLLSMHCHFNNSTYMYILPQLTGALTHWLYTGTPLYIVSIFYCCSLITCCFYLLLLYFFKLHCWLGSCK